MHEIMFATKVLKEAKKAGAEKGICVEVGELVEITPKELEEGLNKLSSGSFDNDEEHKHSHKHHEKHSHSHDFNKEELQDLSEQSKGWNFEVILVESKVECECGFQGRAKIEDRGHGYCLFSCPKCGKKPKVLEGGEIKIVGVE